MRRFYSAVVTLLIAAAATCPLGAQQRTTPVEVKNAPTVSISTSGNTVKVDSVANTVKIDSSTNTVKAQQAGTWNVGLTGTPAVSISGTPTVGISSTANTVQTPTLSRTAQLFVTDKVIPDGSDLSSAFFSCSAYKEIRVIVRSSSNSSNQLAAIAFAGPGAQTTMIGTCRFGLGASSLISGQGFEQYGYTCAFSVPVMGATVQIKIINQSGADVTVFANQSWLHMVN